MRLRKLSPISNLGGCVNRFTVGPSSVGAYPKSGVQSHPGTILGSFTNSCHSLVQLDCALDYSMPSAQDALGYAAWNEIQRKKDRFSALDELIATGDRSLLAGSALGDFSQELLNAPNSLILSGIESPFNDRLLLSSLAMRSGTSSSDILADTSGDLATNRLFAKEPNSFRNEPSARYMGISLPEDLEQLFTLNKSTENEIELLPEDELYMKPLLNHCEGWVLHTDSRCLICRSRHANHLKSQDMAAHSDQRSSRLAGREKISPFVKLHMQQNPESAYFLYFAKPSTCKLIC